MGKILLEISDIYAAWGSDTGEEGKGSMFSFRAQQALLQFGGLVLFLAGMANHAITKTFLHFIDFSPITSGNRNLKD